MIENIDILSLFVIALFGAFGHCIGMCGGIVVAYSASKIDESFSRFREVVSHLLYGAGRSTTYIFLGAIFGFIGAVFSIDQTFKGALFVVAGVFMILIGFSLLGKIKFLNAIEHSVMDRSWFKRSFGILIKDRSYKSFYLLGLLNGLIPCGLVYFFAITAASSSSISGGALVMAVFGVATIIPLFLLGFGVGSLKKFQYRDLFMRLAALFVALFGLYTIIKGIFMIIDPNGEFTPAIIGCSSCGVL